MLIINVGSSSEYHEHPHTHNRYNPLFNDPFNRTNSYTDHHNPLNDPGSSPDEHSHRHKHEDPSRIGHDINVPDNLDGTLPAHKYYMLPDPLFNKHSIPKSEDDDSEQSGWESLLEDILNFFD